LPIGYYKLFKPFVRKCINCLPPNPRRNVEQVAFCMMDIVRNWKLSSEVVTGRISGNRLNGSVVFFGDQRQNRSWVDSFFDNSHTSSELGQFRFFDIARFKHGLSKYDLAVCPVNPATEALFSHQGWRIVPRLIDWVIDLRKPLKEIFQRKNVKKEISRLRKYNYTFKVANSNSALEEFYNEMLIPMVKKRHKELSYISRYGDLLEKLKNGFLLCAYQENNWLGAILVVYESNKIVRAANLGWRNGDIRLMRDHIATALNFELIKRMKSEGFEYLNLGNSLPFVNNGVFQYKNRLGFRPVMQCVDLESGKISRTKGDFLAIYFNLASKSGQAMLHQNPFMEKHGHILRAVAWDSQPRHEVRRLFDDGIPWIDLTRT
jgi:hypothetical protein